MGTAATAKALIPPDPHFPFAPPHLYTTTDTCWPRVSGCRVNGTSLPQHGSHSGAAKTLWGVHRGSRACGQGERGTLLRSAVSCPLGVQLSTHVVQAPLCLLQGHVCVDMRVRRARDRRRGPPGGSSRSLRRRPVRVPRRAAHPHRRGHGLQHPVCCLRKSPRRIRQRLRRALSCALMQRALRCAGWHKNASWCMRGQRYDVQWQRTHAYQVSSMFPAVLESPQLL